LGLDGFVHCPADTIQLWVLDPLVVVYFRPAFDHNWRLVLDVKCTTSSIYAFRRQAVNTSIGSINTVIFSNWKLSTQLNAAFGALIVLILAIVAMALLQMSFMRASTVAIVDKNVPSIEFLAAMDRTLANYRISEMRHVINTDDSAMKGIEDSLVKLRTDFDGASQGFSKLLSTDQERKAFEVFAADWRKYQQLSEKILTLSRSNDDEVARSLLNADSYKTFQSANAEIGSLIALNHDAANAESVKSEDASRSARYAMIGGLVFSMAFAIVVAVLITRSFSRQLGGEPNEAARVAQRVAEGDLSAVIELKHGDSTSLMAQLKSMQQSLSVVVDHVRHGSEGVSIASAEIAQGNQDLSARTENQASALEETASSMEQLGVTVKQNADSAHRANQLALNASTVAVKGGAVVGQVVQTMKEINDASKKISEIISVIDGIAFQTNILALNAAVEAARAGENGRGFAVVASEVRSLAGRSAEAAKEIKSLINASVERVDQGSALVDKAGITMTEVVGSIKLVTDLMGEISAASTEQSLGVAQVGEAVTQMDHATQQNAALVEEMAAAASSLKSQAQELVQVVAVFNLGAEASKSRQLSHGAQTAIARPARIAGSVKRLN
jgi:methyl-accepting chemotaxis protein